MDGRTSNPTAVGRGGPTAPSRLRCLGTRQEPKYWQERGWRRHGEHLLYGYYRTFRGSYEGVIKLFQSGVHQYFIINPPRELAYHSHAQCFTYQGHDGLFGIHFNIQPENVDAGIIVIEAILGEALQQKK